MNVEIFTAVEKKTSKSSKCLLYWWYNVMSYEILTRASATTNKSRVTIRITKKFGHGREHDQWLKW